MIDPALLKTLLILGMFLSLGAALLYHFFDLEEADE